MSLQHTEDDLEEDDELGNSDVREAYKQHCNHARAFVVLRFRHFATFSVIMAFVSTGILNLPEVKDYKEFTISFGIAVTILFWLLDLRTAEYLKYHSDFSRAIETEYFRREKRIQLDLPPPPKRKIFSASTVTNLIFFLILVGWSGFMFIVPSDLARVEARKPEIAATAPAAAATERPLEKSDERP